MAASCSALSIRLALAYAAMFSWIGIYLPYWPVWLADRGMSAAQIGILLGLGPWTRVLASPIAGRWADRSGRPQRIIRGLAVLLVAAVGGFSVAHGFGALLAMTLGMGLLFAPIIPLTDGLTLGAQAEGRLNYGPVRLWGSVAFIAASWLGGELLESHGEPIILWMLVGSAGLLAVAAFAIPAGQGSTTPAPTSATPPDVAAQAGDSSETNPSASDVDTPPSPSPDSKAHPSASNGDTPPSHDSKAHPSASSGDTPPSPSGDPSPFSARSAPFIGFLLVVSLLHLSHAVLYGFATQHWLSQGLDEGTIGMLWAEGVLAEIVLFAFAARVDRWLGPRQLWALAGLGGMVRWAILASTTALPWLWFGQALHALTFGALHLGAMTYLRERVPASARSLATTLYSAIAAGLALGIGLPTAGLLYGEIAGGAYWAMAGCSTLGLLMAGVLPRIEALARKRP